MLYLTRRAGEAIIINNAIEVRVLEVRGRTVRLGVRCPKPRCCARRSSRRCAARTRPPP